MTIKKLTKEQAPVAEVPPMPASGGATIADRFKLDMPDPAARKSSSGKGAICAVSAAVIGLAIAGFLAFKLWNHWEFLMPA